ncbi:Nuclear pore complex protein [Trichinella pseudospiralis]|uniref:Nuclear pore complex protein n=1 Tax=Trichinella pseudospiralis TaxID=6337 RepID=A0A0V1JJM0_TRIPS|nr:Nuclear pore complex protein [Trichinella pseudospiralis]
MMEVDSDEAELSYVESVFERSRAILRNSFLKLNEDSETDTSMLKYTSQHVLSLSNVSSVEQDLANSLSAFDVSFPKKRKPDIKFVEDGLHELESIYPSFLNAYRCNLEKQDISELMSQYENFCDIRLKYLLNMQTSMDSVEFSSSTVASLIKLFKAEKSFWRLLRIFARDRFSNDSSFEDGRDILEKITANSSDADKWNFLLKNDRTFREMRLIMECCEQNAAMWLEECSLPENSHSTTLWSATFRSLCDSGGSSRLKRSTITEMDPDAPFRQNRPLYPEDENGQERFYLWIFRYIRAGCINSAVDLCSEYGMHWLAVSLLGAVPDSGSHFVQSTGRARVPLLRRTGSRKLWKQTCWSLVVERSMPPMERAIYGAVSGHLPSTLHGCRTWEDYLWACACSRSEDRFSKLTDWLDNGNVVTSADLHNESREIDIALFREMFNDVNSIANQRQETDDEFRAFSALIRDFILQEYESVVEHGLLAVELVSSDVTVKDQFCRFLCHVVLAMRHLKLIDNESEQFQTIVEHYLEVLSKNRRHLLLQPFYVGQLSLSKKSRVYAKILQDVTEADERYACLNYGETAGIDMPETLGLLLHGIIGRRAPPASAMMPVGERLAQGEFYPDDSNYWIVSQEDCSIMEALKWFLIDENYAAAAVTHILYVVRHFILQEKFASAKKALSLLNTEVIERAKVQICLEDVPLVQQHLEAVDEIQDWQEYFMAHGHFETWSECYHLVKPAEMSDTSESASYPEEFQFMQRRKLQKMRSRDWTLSLQSHTDMAVYSMRKVLDRRNYSKDWLFCQCRKEDPEVYQQIQAVRNICLPRMCYMMLYILRATENHQKVLDLTTIIADNADALCEAFDRSLLQHLLTELTESCLENLKCMARFFDRHFQKYISNWFSHVTFRYYCMEANDSPQTGTQLLPKRSKVNFASLTEEQKVRIQELNEGDPAYWQHWRLMKRFSISRRTLLRVLKHECQDEVKLSHNANNNKIQINNTADEGNLQPTWPVEITDQDGPFMTIYKEHKNFVHKLKSDL